VATEERGVVKKYFDGGVVPIYSWMSDQDEGTMEQIRHVAGLPFAFHHVAIMADGHVGYGIPIGGVLAAKGTIIPYAVGSDIGCGMIAQKTSVLVESVSTDDLKMIMKTVRDIIPVGREHHAEAQDEELMPEMDDLPGDVFSDSVVGREYESARTQIGTLGQGNHFWEVQSDGQYVWVMIHSGSRNLGYRVADHYNKIAVKLNEKWHTGVPKEWQLAFLPHDSDEGHAYFQEMQYCVEFALANRRLMMSRTLEAMVEFIPGFAVDGDAINIAHNYAEWENHYGENVIVHRKGATRAREGEMGIIPGSQGSASYIVRGLGNRESFQSCSHGAGRKMSRRAACDNLVLEDEIAKLDALGVVHGVRNKADLDEAPGSYKDIETVMDNQRDLVEIMVRLKPLAVVKG
jgi:tRNA-splicing ligase RtcB